MTPADPPAHNNVLELLPSRSSRVVGGDLSEGDPLDIIIHGESVVAWLTLLGNGTEVLTLEVYVDDVDPHQREQVEHWVATNTGRSPFTAFRVSGGSGGDTDPVTVLVSHSFMATSITADQVDEVTSRLISAMRSRPDRSPRIATRQPMPSPSASRATASPCPSPNSIMSRAPGRIHEGVSRARRR